MKNPIKFSQPAINKLAWFWDTDGVKIPKNLSLKEVVGAIQRGQQHHKIIQPPCIYLNGQEKHKKHYKDELVSMGVYNFDVEEGKNKADALLKRHLKAWMKSRKPTNIQLLVADKDYCSYVRKLKQRNHKVLLAADENNLHQDLKKMVDINWKWLPLLNGTDIKGEVKEEEKEEEEEEKED